MENKKFRGYIIAVALFVFIFVNMGGVGCLSVFMPSIVAETGYSTTQISLMFTFAGVASALCGLLITPTVLKKLGPKKCMLIATICTALSLFLYGRTSSLAVFYFAAALGGFAIGIGYFAACGSMIGNWFFDKRLSIIGAISAASGLGGTVFKSLSGYAITAFGYRTAYVFIALSTLVVGLIVQLIVRDHPSELGQTALGAEKMDLQSSGSAGSAELPGLSFKEALKTPSFYLIFFGGALGIIAYMGMSMYMVTLLATNYGMSLTSAANYNALFQFAVMVAVFFSGRIAEKIGIRGYILYVGIAMSAGLLLIVLFGSSIIGAPVALIAAAVLVGVGGSHQSSDSSILAQSCFGAKDFATIQAYLIGGVNAGSALTAIVAAPFIGADGSMLPCFRVFFVLSVVWMIMMFVGSVLAPYKEKTTSK